MKGKKLPPPSPSILGYCARLALLLTAVVALGTLIALPFQRGPEILPLAAAIFAGFTLVVWSASLSIGLAVVLGGWSGRLFLRIALGRPKFRVRDRWLDDPLPY